MAAKIPNSLKAAKPFFIISHQLESKDPVVSYYVRMYGLEQGLQAAKNDPEANAFLGKEMTQLSGLKKKLNTEDAIKDEIVGQAHVENYALNLFDVADGKDRAADFSKAVSKAFYTASQVFVTLKQFGEFSEEIEGKMKYAKWKAVEIDRCLKNGITPTPGPPGGFEDPTELRAPPTQPPAGTYGYQPESYGDQPGPSGNYGYQPDSYGDQPGPSGGYSEQPKPTVGYGNQPGPSYPQPTTNIGFDLPPPVPYETPPPQPQLPADVKPVPKPRHDPHPTPPQPVARYEAPAPRGGNVELSPADTAKAQKYCKFASSAIEYDDIEGAIEYLIKATNLLRTGKED